jgi:hypothetical protein
MKWEQKSFTQTLKTLAVNAFIKRRIGQNKGMLENKESFIGLEHVLKCLKSLQSLADFVLDAAKELNIRAELLEKQVQREDASNDIGNGGWTPKYQAMRNYGFVAKPDLTNVIIFQFG